MTMVYPVYLIGAGGHAKVLVDILDSRQISLSGYVDHTPAAWLEKRGVKRITEEMLEVLLPSHPHLVMGFVGLNSAALVRRLKMLKNYAEKGAVFPNIIHQSAVVSPHAFIASGVQIFANAVVNSHAVLEMGAILNSSAVVEHDSSIGEGVHIAPCATVLGGAKIGHCAYIGSGAVIIQNMTVSAQHFVKALALYNESV